MDKIAWRVAAACRPMAFPRGIVAADVNYKVQGNQMHMAVPRKLLKMTDDPVQFDFKWLDNIALPLPNDLSVFYTDGDTAPTGRFRFRYLTK